MKESVLDLVGFLIVLALAHLLGFHLYLHRKGLTTYEYTLLLREKVKPSKTKPNNRVDYLTIQRKTESTDLV